MPEAPAMIVAGRYRLVHRIAAGGMGEIFLAVQDGPQGFQKLVALKRILPGVATDRNTVQHFLDEAQLTSRLSHRNIAQVFDFGQDREGYFAAMEYVQGPTMASLLDRLAERHQRLAPALALDIAAQVADALAYAWEVRGPDGAPSRVVHRDISPQNIMVSVSGDVKLIDFGVAKSAQQLHATIGSSIKGKLAYMSPEQGSGDPIDTRSDLFCLGVVLCEMLTGVHPFARNDLLQIMQAARSEPPKLPSAIDASLAFIDSALLKMLAKDPRERFQDGHEAHEALQALRPKAPASPLRLGALVSECFGQELDALVSKDRR
ncbi:MAG: serine/threonine protein kinase, partial [Deltaproteobacteria bacterium]|nr:serine/threonine protein kinase [Deltaproteobacteria bacterium]